MPFVCAGYPELTGPDGLGAVLRAIEGQGDGGGGCICEIGIPFSDPVADGPVIAAAMHEALQRGVTPERVFAAVGEARAGIQMGLVAMVSVSIVWKIGPQVMISLARRAGIDGFIIPDLPPDQDPDLLKQIADAGLITSVLIAPTTTEQRAAELVRHGSGFIYLLARVGVTGAGAGGGADSPADLGSRVKMLRGLTDLPIACGFGISTAEDVRRVTRGSEGGADAAIVGSAMVKRMAEAYQKSGDRGGAEGGRVAAAARAFTAELAVGLS